MKILFCHVWALPDFLQQVERGPAVYLSGLREKYFGEIFLNASRFLRGIMPDEASNSFYGQSQSDICHNLDSNESVGQRMDNCWSSENIFYGKKELLEAAYEDGLNHIARFVESFESLSNEIWLVFHHEGMSLSKLLYTAEEVGADEQSNEHAKRVQILHPSKWWHWLKTTKAGQEEMRNLIWQLVCFVFFIHFYYMLKIADLICFTVFLLIFIGLFMLSHLLSPSILSQPLSQKELKCVVLFGLGKSSLSN